LDGKARVVYSWSFNEKRLEEEFDLGELPPLGFYVLAALKILYLVEKFNVQLICMDKGGGGPAIADVLKAPTLYSIPRDYAHISVASVDDEMAMAGSKRILNLISFTNEFIVTNNYSMKKDIQSDKFVFSNSNVEKSAMDIVKDKRDFLVDEFDYINSENEAMKREISIVKVLRTQHGNIRFDTGAGGRRPKKDRYTAAFLSYVAFQSMSHEDDDKEEIKINYYDSVGDVVTQH